MVSNSFLEVKKPSQYNIKKQLYSENTATAVIFRLRLSLDINISTKYDIQQNIDTQQE